MIFFGVQRKEGVWLRTVGVPRLVADPLGSMWQQSAGGEPGSYEQLRSWVSQLDDREWQRAIPAGSRLRPEDMRLIWHEFTG
jgi:hypothetical protein